MINTNESNPTEESQTGANGPVSVEKLKEYGKKAYQPLIDVVFKYQDEFTPYLNALAKGLQGGVESLSKENSSEAEKYVSQFFKEAADGLSAACTKLEAKDVNALRTFLTEQAERRPSLMFSTSYAAGIFFGRLARHVAKNRTLTNEPPTLEQSLH